MKVILWTSPEEADIASRLSAIPEIQLVAVDGVAGLKAALPGTEALVISGSLYQAETAAVLRGVDSRLRWIQLLSAGYERLSRHGVPPGVVVSNAGDCYSPMVAEHAMAPIAEAAGAALRNVTQSRTSNRRHLGGAKPNATCRG